MMQTPVQNPFPKYQHNPLSPGKHIRVLSLQPALKFFNPIECSLYEVSLDDVRDGIESYDALSYVWGSPVGDQPILCDGEELLVTTNCLTALLYLRRKRKTRILWIDSICIDQTSIPDKNQQVERMGTIYKLASKVLIWFGGGNPAIIKLIAEMKVLSSYLQGRRKLLDKFPSLIRWVKDEDESRAAKQHLIQAVDNEWFHRVWTIQELCLAKTPIVVYGHQTILWEHLSLCLFHTGSPASNNPLVVRTYNMWISTAITREEFVKPTADPTAGPLRRNLDDEPIAPRNHIDYSLVNLARKRQARVLLDKVYSIRGMVMERGFTMSKPNYHLGSAVVYMELTYALIKGSRSLELLHVLLSKQRMPDLPSWVPDFNEPPWPNRGYTVINHRVAVPELLCFEQSGNDLTVGGRLVDTINEVSHRMPDRPEDFSISTTLEHVHTLRTWCSEFNNRSLLPSTTVHEPNDFHINLFPLDVLYHDAKERATRISAASRCLPMFRSILEKVSGTADDLSRSDDQQAQIEKLTELFVRMTLEGQTPYPKVTQLEMAEFAGLLIIDFSYKVLIHSEHGQWGTSIANVQVGDRIALLTGSRAPFALRPQAGQPGKYELVGAVSMATLSEDLWDSLYDVDNLERITMV